MKISSIIDIIGGELKNSPSISFVYSIKTNAKRVNEGDIFIAKNDKDIKLAITNGAFAIIYDFDTIILDLEIAWIKVQSSVTALIKLFRFTLSSCEINAYYCDKFTYDLLYNCKTLNKNMKFISNNLENSIKVIENIKNSDILISYNQELLNMIYPKNNNFNQKKYKVKNLITHSLFESSFSFEEIYFSRIKLASLYVNEFLNVFTFFKKNIDILKLKKIDILRPIFVDKFIDIIDYGKSDKFLIAQKSEELFLKEYEFIKKEYKYAKTIYITTRHIKNLKEDQYIISSLKELKETLKNKKFNCAYILGFDLQRVEKTLLNQTSSKSLF